MGSKGNKRHLKRLCAPKFYKMERKKYTFILKPNAGPHPGDFCFPLGFVIRNILHLAGNTREIDYILKTRKVLVDGKILTEPNYPVGLMDVIEIPEISKAFRILPSKSKGLCLSEITKEEAKFKLCRIENISTVRNGHLQLNLHDGRNILMKVKDPTKKPDIPYHTMDTLKISIPEQKIMEHYSMEKNRQALVFRGKNQGIYGKVVNIIKRFGSKASVAILERIPGENISTAYEYAFIIGNEKSCIDLPNE